MDFSLGDRLEELLGRVRGFMEENVYPVEAEAMQALDDEVEPGVAYPEIIVGIREKARAEGLWNLFMPGEEHGAGLTNWEYGMLCEEMGRSPVVAPMAPRVPHVFTRMRKAGFSKPNWRMTSSSWAWMTSECPSPP